MTEEFPPWSGIFFRNLLLAFPHQVRFSHAGSNHQSFPEYPAFSSIRRNLMLVTPSGFTGF